MKNRPLVSIIIPVFNAQRTIRKTLDSALKQSYENIELIVIDDGSTDDTAFIVHTYLSRGVIKYEQTQNKGPAHARNIGLNHVKGEFISFLDADDWYHPGKIEEQIKACKEADMCPDVILCESEYLLDGKKYRYTGKTLDKNRDAKSLLYRGNFININTALVKTSFINKHNVRFDSGLRTAEDWDFWIRIANFGARFMYINKILVTTQIHMDSSQTRLSLVDQKKDDIAVLKKNNLPISFTFFIKLLLAAIIEWLPRPIRNRLVFYIKYARNYEEV